MKGGIIQRLKSRTYWAALFLAALTIIEAHVDIVALIIPASWLPYWPLVFPLVMMIMREVTTAALADK